MTDIAPAVTGENPLITVAEIIRKNPVSNPETDTTSKYVLSINGKDYVNSNQDFTDKYVKCCECGKYISLGDITNLLPENMICDHSTRGHYIAYLDTNIWGVMDYEKVIYDINNPN